MTKAKLKVNSAGYDSTSLSALSETTVPVESGSLTLITGANGTGKTTLLRIVSGTHEVEGGWADSNISSFRERTQFRNPLYLPQDARNFFLFPTAISDLLSLAQSYNRNKEACVADFRNRLQEVGLSGYEHRSSTILSEGERRILALAISFAIKPSFLLIDEPLASLDDKNSSKIIEWIKEYINEGGSSLVSTHDSDIEVPNKYHKKLKDKDNSIKENKLTKIIKNRNISNNGRGLKLEGEVIKIRSPRNIWGNISWKNTIMPFCVAPGSLVGVCGSNGSGKSTLLRTISGVRPPDSGKVYYGNEDVTANRLNWSRWSILENNFFHVPQKVLGIEHKKLVKDIVNLYTNNSKESNGNNKKVVGHLLSESGGSRVRDLSGGQKKFLYVLMSLLSAKPVLLLDEPLEHLDNTFRKVIMHAINNIDLSEMVVFVSQHSFSDDWHLTNCVNL